MISLPIATVLTLTGGLIFGWRLGSLLILLSATVGAVGAFLIARYTLSRYVSSRFPKFMEKVNRGVDNDGWVYLLAARLSALVPFFVLNLVSGLTSISLRDYTLATMLGIIPGTVVYAYAGQQLGEIADGEPLVSTSTIITLILIGLTPLLLRYISNKLKGEQVNE
jgi:uncharacterized membrane protein YdjX (TVP38/TMEM64 family)